MFEDNKIDRELMSVYIGQIKNGQSDGFGIDINFEDIKTRNIRVWAGYMTKGITVGNGMILEIT